jgi:hypothetical protein
MELRSPSCVRLNKNYVFSFWAIIVRFVKYNEVAHWVLRSTAWNGAQLGRLSAIVLSRMRVQILKYLGYLQNKFVSVVINSACVSVRGTYRNASLGKVGAYW